MTRLHGPLRLAALALFAALFGAPALAQPAETLRAFEEGNRRYAQGEYRAALVAYEEAAATGYVSGPLFYNMGNAYFRLDQVGQAIRYYEKARRLMPAQPELLHNLQIARARTVDQFPQLPTPFWTRWWRQLQVLVGAGGFFLVGLLFYVAAAALFAYRIWTGTRNAWHRRMLTLSALAGLLLLGTAFLASLDRRLHRSAVVVSAQAPLREAPAPEATATLDVHEGLLLDVLHEQDGWLEVRLPNGASGWIRAEALAEV